MSKINESYINSIDSMKILKEDIVDSVKNKVNHTLFDMVKETQSDERMKEALNGLKTSIMKELSENKANINHNMELGGFVYTDEEELERLNDEMSLLKTKEKELIQMYKYIGYQLEAVS